MKLRKTFNGNLKAVSPVIATIIIVAIAITMSIAVAYWLLGLGGSFTKFEKVEFTTAYTDVTPNSFVVTMNLKNTGSASATLDNSTILYNGKPASGYASATPSCLFNASITNTQITMAPGESATGKISLPTTGTWTSGMTVEITLHTTGGKDYPKVITLP